MNRLRKSADELFSADATLLDPTDRRTAAFAVLKRVNRIDALIRIAGVEAIGKGGVLFFKEVSAKPLVKQAWRPVLQVE